VHVVLIHGMGRTPWSLWPLARALEAAGHTTSRFGYLVHRDTLGDIAARFVEHVGAHGGTAVVGHSLGNIITRMALPELTSLTHFAMLAPPNQPPQLARTFGSWSAFRSVTGDAGQRLRDASFYATLPVPAATLRTTIVAGTGGPTSTLLPWKGKPTDGVVAVDETRLGSIRVLEVPAVHTFIMNHRDTRRHVQDFLATRAE
jgi:hypothetical protein